jgi:hypothetical protein
MCCQLYAQENAQAQKPVAEPVKKMVFDTAFIFQAQSVTPMQGKNRYLDPGYIIRVNRDTVMADLPYFGRAYQSGYGNSDDGGIKGTSTQFDYVVKDRKKGGWDISIRTKDLTDRLQFNMTVFEDGKASVTATSNSRQTINYDGYIEAKQNPGQ